MSQNPFEEKPSGPSLDSGSKFLLGANAVLLLLWAWWTFRTYHSLPATIPLHFGPSGAADRWGERSIPNWFLLLFVGAGMAGIETAVAMIIPLLVRKRPELVNLPKKARFLALPEEEKRKVGVYLRWMMLFPALIMTAGLWMIHGMIYETIRTGGDRLGISQVLFPLALMMGGFVIGTIVFFKNYLKMVRD